MPAITSGSIQSRIIVNGLKALNIGSASYPFDQSTIIPFTNGTGAGQMNAFFTDTRTLAASATEDLDLAGVLVDWSGLTLTFTKIKALFISAAAANTNNVVVGAGAAPWIGLLNAAGTITLRPGANFQTCSGVLDATGMVVTATTADILKVANSAGTTSVNYSIFIGGVA